MVFQRYTCNLSTEVLHKAHKELFEPLNNNERLSKIDELIHSYNSKYPDEQLNENQKRDQFLLKFLRARKFDMKRSVKLLKNYLNKEKIFPEVFEKIKHPHLLKSFLETRFITVLNGRAKNSSAIVFLRPCHNCENTQIFDIFSAAFLTFETLINDEVNQIHGVTVIEDFFHANRNIVKQMGPIIGKKFTTIIQDCLPIRLKNMCFVHENFMITLVYTIVKPFLKQKTRDRIVMVGDNHERLAAIVDVSNLPAAIGGVLDEDQLQYDEWKDKLLGGSDV